MFSKLIKIISYIKIYGVSRTLYKVLGRTRRTPRLFRFRNSAASKKISVGFIGCGQFAFTVSSYFLRFSKRFYFKFAYDPNHEALTSFCKFNNIKTKLTNPEELINHGIDILYIASNHHTHAEYAISALKKNISVYIEKPIAVTWEQFNRLGHEISISKATVYVGYNRPFSKAITELKKHINPKSGPISLNCFVVGHFLEKDHWYRKSAEGTRICGNLGHWLDLAIHLLAARSLPSYLDILIGYSNPSQSDDDLSVILISDTQDLINITLSSRSEPFEGINEALCFHQADLIVNIQDFRQATFWHKHKKRTQRYFPKDVGHKKAILQPIHQNTRDLDEIRISTALMLEITDMVRNRTASKRFHINSDIYKWHVPPTN